MKKSSYEVVALMVVAIVVSVPGGIYVAQKEVAAWMCENTS